MAVALGAPTAADIDRGWIDPVRLSRELARRGKNWTDLTVGEDGARINANTVTRIRRQQSVHPGTNRKVGRWLAANPVLPELEAVLTQPPMDGAA